MDLTRRCFLQLSGSGLAALAGAGVWLDPRLARSAGSAHTDPLLVAIFLRGGADGLALVPPVGDASYRRLRGELALAEGIPFVTGFHLHPALSPLGPLARSLAVVHAAGSPHPTRSHFEAQDRMELGAGSGTASGGDGARLRDGWLARALRGRADPADAFAALALTGGLPQSLRGSGAFALADSRAFGISGADAAARRALARIYAAAEGDPVAEAGQRALAALDEFDRLMGAPAGKSAARHRRDRRGRGRPSLEAGVGELLALEGAGLPVRAFFLESSGWDTHTRQGSSSGELANLAGDLGRALAKLAAGLEGRRDWIAVAMTEFGRTVRPNGSAGSDHGHGSVMLVAGPRVSGGLHGAWPGLADAALHEGRDLAVATDYRNVLWEVLRAHLGAPPPGDTFPGFAPLPLGLFG